MNPALAYIDSKTGKPPELISRNVKSPKECEAWLKSQVKLGQRYAFGYKSIYGGNHIIQVRKKITGQLEFYDPQRGTIFNRDLLILMEHGAKFGKLSLPVIFRVDDKELNTEILDTITKPVEKK